MNNHQKSFLKALGLLLFRLSSIALIIIFGFVIYIELKDPNDLIQGNPINIVAVSSIIIFIILLINFLQLKKFNRK